MRAFFFFFKHYDPQSVRCPSQQDGNMSSSLQCKIFGQSQASLQEMVIISSGLQGFVYQESLFTTNLQIFVFLLYSDANSKRA